MSREITLAAALPGTTLCIHIDGPNSRLDLSINGAVLAFVALDSSTPPVIHNLPPAEIGVRVGLTYFPIQPHELCRLQQWLAEVQA